MTGSVAMSTRLGEPRTFVLTGALPSGTTVLEASAGTGKTYAIVGLAARFIAEGRPLSELLLITFTRAAAEELRERLRLRLRGLAAGLERGAGSDELVEHYRVDAATVLPRIRAAMSDLDAATITTTHGFCQRALTALGIAGEREPDVRVVDDATDLIREVVDDLYVRKYAVARRGETDSGGVRVPYPAAQRLGREAVANREATIVPDAESETEAGQRAALAAAVRQHVERRKRAGGIRDYTDLQLVLCDVLRESPAAAAFLADRHRIVLVDEFQDTDPTQWEVLRTAFHQRSVLVLVGDPKQAIYSFRGADVDTYLAATQAATDEAALGTNRRSDADLVRALDRLYGGSQLGAERIVVRPVEATTPGSRIVGVAPLALRGASDRKALGRMARDFPRVNGVRVAVARDVARYVHHLLTVVRLVDADGTERAVQPDDIAVLVRKNLQLPLVATELDKLRVPAIIAKGTSVFESPAAQEWLALLRALERPGWAGAVRRAALSPLFGLTAVELDVRGDDAVADVAGQLRDLNRTFVDGGVAAVFDALSVSRRVPERLLSRPGGERLLTDLRHLAQLLGAHAAESGTGLPAMSRWLADQVADHRSGADAQPRRLDSDAAAVSLLTVHHSKGLEFPIVLVPFAWEGSFLPRDPFVFHDADGRRCLEVCGRTTGDYYRHANRNLAENSAEELRLLYVSVTRARHHVALWHAPVYGGDTSPASRLLLGRDGAVPPTAPPPRARVGSDDTIGRELAAIAAASGGLVSLARIDPTPATDRWDPPAADRPTLTAARFDGTIDDEWRRTSYSALTAAAHDAPPETGVRDDDEPADAEDTLVGGLATSGAAGDSPPSPMNDLPYGAAFGTLVHEILEYIDTSAADLDAEVAAHTADTAARLMPGVDVPALASALTLVLRSPAGLGREGTAALADVRPRDRLAELEFELPLGGGLTPRREASTLADIAAALDEHLPASDPLAGYADHLRRVGSAPLRGFLTGSIDAVIRDTGAGEASYVVVDYKTNRLGLGDLTAAHYTAPRMCAEMIAAHYPLQALLYQVALHRYLRWRLPGYAAERHLGGARYLFVRGMIGPDAPPGSGVFDWRPPAVLVEAVSQLLGGTS